MEAGQRPGSDSRAAFSDQFSLGRGSFGGHFVHAGMSRKRILPLLSVVLFAAPLAGCSGQGDPDLDEDAVSSELGAPCAIGSNGCGDLKVLKGKTYTSSRPPAVRRSDVTVDLSDPSHDARVFSRLTSRALTFDGTKKVTLAGDAAGNEPIRVDDFLLVEVLSSSGALLAAGAINSESVRVNDKAAAALAPIPAWGGPEKGWTYAAGSVDISSLLPENVPFRLRLSAIDVAGYAVTTDVFLKVDDATSEPAPPPPPPPVNDDPWNPASCAGTPATVADFAGRFAPGATKAYLGNYHVQVRTRDCNEISGCTEWRPYADAIDMKLSNASSVPVPTGDPLTGAMMLEIASGKIFPRFVNATCWHKGPVSDSVCAAFDLEKPDASYQYKNDFGWGCSEDIARTPGRLRCGGYTYTPGLQWASGQGRRAVRRILRGFDHMADPRDSNMPYAYAFVGKSCTRVFAHLDSSRSATHSETEVATLIRY